MKKCLYIVFVFWLLLFNNVYWYTVNYSYYPTVSDFKSIQNLWTIKNDSGLDLREHSYSLKVISGKGTQSNKIPKYTKIEKSLIDKFGIDKIQKIISKYLIKIWNNEYWLIDRNKNLYANIINYRDIRINVDVDTYSTLKLYPISPNFYSSPYLNEVEFDKNMNYYPTLLTLYSPIDEYYNVHWVLISNMQTADDYYKTILNWEYSKLEQSEEIKIEQKYEVIKFKRKYFNWSLWTSKVILPYYEMKLDLKKWENRLLLSYWTYVEMNNDIDWTIIQIK